MSGASKAAWLIAVAALTLACSRSHSQLDRSGDDGSPTLSGRVYEDQPAAGDITAGEGDSRPQSAGARAPGAGNGAGAAGSLADPPAAAGARSATSLGDGYDVWVGELRSTTPAVCGFDPSSATDASSNPGGWSWPHPEGYFERVVLILEQAGEAAELTGRVAFGEGTPPATPIGLEADYDQFWMCPKQNPSKGFEYNLFAPRLSSERLQFEIAPNEIWSDFCATQTAGCGRNMCEIEDYCTCQPHPSGVIYCPGDSRDPDLCYGYPPCRCDADSCSAWLWYRIRFDLAITARTMEGSVNFLGDIRLRQVE